MCDDAERDLESVGLLFETSNPPNHSEHSRDKPRDSVSCPCELSLYVLFALILFMPFPL